MESFPNYVVSLYAAHTRRDDLGRLRRNLSGLWLGIALLFLLVLLIAGCGGSGAASNSGGGTNPLTSITVLTVSSNSIAAGSSLILTAGVTPTTATGTVTFYDGSSVLGSQTVNGSTASITTSSLAVGSHSLTAAYGGNSSYAASTSGPIAVIVNALSSSIGLSVSNTTGLVGSVISLIATVAPVAATGSVTFYDGSNALATVVLSSASASFSTTALAAGTHTLKAVYGGSTTYGTSTSSALTVTIAGSWTWWPSMAQPSSQAITVHVVTPETGDATNGNRDTILLQSLAGLAAKAYNATNSNFHELVWINKTGEEQASYAMWLQLMESRLGISTSISVKFDTTQYTTSAVLLPYLWNKGIIKGYDYYNICNCSPPSSTTGAATAIDQMDHSLNIATMDAGIYSRALFPYDMADQSWTNGKLALVNNSGSVANNFGSSIPNTAVEASYFLTNAKLMNTQYALIEPMSNYEMRDMAIAFGTPVFYAAPGPTGVAPQYFDQVMSFLATGGASTTGVPLPANASSHAIGNIWGWDDGVDEGTFVQEISFWGNMFIPSETGMNFTVLSAFPASTNQTLPSSVPTSTQVSTSAQTQSGNSYILTEGDNLSFDLGLYVDRGKYWDNSESGTQVSGTCTKGPCAGPIPYGYSIAAGDLAMISPDAWSYFVQNLPPNANILSGVGYVYPDVFGAFYNSTSSYSDGTNTPNSAILTAYAQRLNGMLTATGARMITFLCRNSETASAATSAYDILSANIANLDGAYVLQYSPYNGGLGSTHWSVPPGGGSPVPFATATYGIWISSNTNEASPYSLVEDDKLGQSAAGTFTWTTVHAFDQFGIEAGAPSGTVPTYPSCPNPGSVYADPCAVQDSAADSSGNGWSISAAKMADYYAAKGNSAYMAITPALLLWNLRYLHDGQLPSP